LLTIPDTKVVYAIGPENKPVATCHPGDTITFETKDCFSNQIQKESDLFESVGWAAINPATGPLFIEGAVPGDTLKVTIQDIEIRSYGVMVAVPRLGAFGHLVDKSTTKIVPIENGQARFSTGISFALDPMIGVIGTAPVGDAVPCGTPGPHGGNMDTRHIRKGATVYLPVNVPGALLCLGDLHAVMADGEVVVCGVEVAGKVSAQVNVLKAIVLPCPVVEDAENTYFLCSAGDLDEASNQVLESALYHIMSRTGMALSEVAMLLSLTGHLEISQVVDPLKTARLRIPAEVGKKLGIRLTAER